MNKMKKVIPLLIEKLGIENILSDTNILREYSTATFNTTQKASLVTLPESKEEIRHIIKIANKYKISLYPISGGRNLGLGSRVPIKNNSCVVDLKRMNKILEFNEELSYIVIEPGVTFRQISDYLNDKKTDLFLSVTGGPSDASVIANTLEKGDGVGPYGDRADYCCGLEVITPTGKILNTGMGVFKNTLVRNLTKFGLGPDTSGLFYQSNFGIVTKMTLWLSKRPLHFQFVLFTVTENHKLNRVISGMQKLKHLGIIKNNSYTLWNIYKFIATQMKYPFDKTNGKVILPKDVLKYLPKAWKGVKWIGMAALYSPSLNHARADKKMVRKILRRNVGKIIIINSFNAKLMKIFKKPLSTIMGIDIGKTIDMLFYNSVFLGVPSDNGITSIYWRKKEIPKDINPEKDQCGLYWICVSVPFISENVIKANFIAENIILNHGFEPQIMFFCINERYIKSFVVIAFDRNNEDEEKRARKCHDQLFKDLNAEGYTANRLGIQSMDLIAPFDKEYLKFIWRIKKMMDPNDVLASGRYDFRSQRFKECR